MASFLGKVTDNIGDFISNNPANKVNQRDFEKDGFIVPPVPSASGNGLPSSQVLSQRDHTTRRHIIHWFVPEVGVINMYINPQSISYTYKKLITSDRTKGGYVLQYWGNELPTMTLHGHTGSSGVEGLNVLYEIYRSEQLGFDPIGLSFASNNSVSGLGDLVSGVGGILGGLGGDIFGSVTNGILGANPVSQSIVPQNPPTLASLAFGVEMYYAGWVMRGFFTGMTVTESVNNMGLFEYDIQFTVTQRRGYRLNEFAWQHSANSGPSNNSVGGVPLSYGHGFVPSSSNKLTDTVPLTSTSVADALVTARKALKI